MRSNLLGSGVGKCSCGQTFDFESERDRDMKFQLYVKDDDDERKRATNRIWSEATYRLRDVVEEPDNQVMYNLSDGPERAFVSEELLLIPKDTEVPPDYVQIAVFTISECILK